VTLCHPSQLVGIPVVSTYKETGKTEKEERKWKEKGKQMKRKN
jgi:hypothetical protein